MHLRWLLRNFPFVCVSPVNPGSLCKTPRRSMNHQSSALPWPIKSGNGDGKRGKVGDVWRQIPLIPDLTEDLKTLIKKSAVCRLQTADQILTFDSDLDALRFSEVADGFGPTATRNLTNEEQLLCTDNLHNLI